MNLNDKISVELSIGTLAVLISGLYIANTGINIEAVPSSLFIEIAEQIAPYLSKWDYDNISFEDWINYNLLIIPKQLCSDDELESFKNNDFYIERRLGNVTLIATGEMI